MATTLSRKAGEALAPAVCGSGLIGLGALRTYLGDAAGADAFTERTRRRW